MDITVHLAGGANVSHESISMTTVEDHVLTIWKFNYKKECNEILAQYSYGQWISWVREGQG